VTLVLRLIRKSRWSSAGTLDWLAEGEFPADPLGDFNTANNCLSVWLIDDDKRELPHVVAALAATRHKPDNLDYVLFPLACLDGAAIEVREAEGDTADAEVNGYHRNLIRLSAAKVLDLTKRVWHEKPELGRIDRRPVVRLIAESVRGGRIELKCLQPRVKEAVERLLSEPQDEPGKPR